MEENTKLEEVAFEALNKRPAGFDEAINAVYNAGYDKGIRVGFKEGSVYGRQYITWVTHLWWVVFVASACTTLGIAVGIMIASGQAN